jgi:8-oxo-dGTP pyrophosphatase MutT (NUDIX family)
MTAGCSDTTRIARDGEEFAFNNAGQDWIVSFHPATLPAPDGRNHGSTAFCFTQEGQIVLVSKDGVAWEPPAGRPEDDESLRETLDREVLEEASARVDDAVLLGYSRGICTKGHEEGLVLVRSLWWASVSILPYVPDYEMKYRLLVASGDALARIGIEPLFPTLDYAPRPSGNSAIFRRFYRDALAVQARKT